MGESAEATPTNETLRRELATIQAELSRTVAALERERERTEAVRIVLNAVLASLPNRGLNRRQFQAIVAQAGRETPDEGPQAVRHTVLLTEARVSSGSTSTPRSESAGADPAGRGPRS